jgi:ankyrin repeat protein
MIASRCGRHDVVKALLKRGANVHALSQRDPETGKGGNTALWCASQGRRTGRAAVARTLLDAGSDVDFHGEYGETPLHVAVAWRHVDVGRQLLEHGADPNPTTDRGETPLDFAVKWNFREMENLVRAYGGKTIAVASAVIIA